MRVLAFFGFLGMAAAALSACGGKVIVDGVGEGEGGAGGAGGSPASSTHASTSSSASSSVSSSGTGVTCPAMFPGIEATCSQEGQVCPVPLACCNGTAVCKGGRWRFSSVPCKEVCTGLCGPDNFACKASAVCVAYIGKTTTYQCRQQPCAGPLSCPCAAPLCDEQKMVCNNIQDGFKVLCDCKGQC